MTANRFTVNGVTYTAKPFDFGMVCDLESVGISITSASTMNMSFIRGYFAVCAGLDKDEAAKQIQEHIIKGGTLEDISDAMTKEMTDSDFFRAISKKTEAGAGEDITESKTEKKRGRKPIEAVE